MPMADGDSLIQKTFQRVMHLEDVSEMLTVTNREHYFQTLDEFSKIDIPQAPRLEFLLEPVGRNTAPAIAMAAFYATEHYGADAVMLVLPADHVIEKQEMFAAAVLQAKKMASQGYLVTFGLQPQHADTGFGYIEVGSSLTTLESMAGITVSEVDSFAEKPSLELAEHYVQSGSYLWNAGIFCFSAATFLTALKQHAPQLYSGCEQCWRLSVRTCGPVQLEEESFSALPSISVDYAVMEKAANVAVVGCDLGWSDVGSWAAMSDMVAADRNGNRVDGAAMMLDSSDSYVRSDKRIIAAVGIKDLIVVDTPDALLIADKQRVQDVKKVVEQLKERAHPCYRTHNTVHRPWGTYTELERGERFKIKRIVVNPEASLSLQIHYHRSDTGSLSAAPHVSSMVTKPFSCRPTNRPLYPVDTNTVWKIPVRFRW